MNETSQATRSARGGWSEARRRIAIALIGLIIGGIVLVATAMPAGAVERWVLPSGTEPISLTDQDASTVEVGVRLVSNAEITLTSVRIFLPRSNEGPHAGRIWDAHGAVTRTFTVPATSHSGWAVTRLDEPLLVAARNPLVVSYTATQGRYAAEPHGFDRPISDGTVSYPQGAGVYSYETDQVPDRTFRNTNYFIDIGYRTGRPTETPPKPATASPETMLPDLTGPTLTLPLPRIAWEGGPDYWKRFAATERAGWDDPGFFPVVIWYNGFSSDSEVAYDKAAGINTYIGMWEGTPYSLFERNQVFWIGPKLNDSFTDDSRYWVGNNLGDEVEGKNSNDFTAGRAELQSALDAAKGNGRFNYANFSQMVISTYMTPQDAGGFVNDYTDAVSEDMYWYTVPFCDWRPYQDIYLVPIAQSNCRTSSSYGKAVQAMRIRDEMDGKLQPIWQFVEDLNGGPGDPHVGYITPAQLKGAVMNSLISEARGIVYFNQSLSGPCRTSGALRSSQVAPDFCGAAQMEAMSEVNNQIKALAPVLNTQSYAYRFGSGLDTMLKTYGDSAYVFAMIDGSSTPGSRTFQLPKELRSASVSVVGENRTITVESGKFTDDFAQESSYHIYRVTPG